MAAQFAAAYPCRAGGDTKGGQVSRPCKRPQGRPAIPAALRRDVRLVVRLTPAESRQLARDARAAGVELSAYVRERCGLVPA